MAMNVTPFVGTDNFNMETFNNMISQINSGVNSEISDVLAQLGTQLGTKAEIMYGSYVGTGTYGTANPCSLTFDFEPLFGIILGNKSPIADFNQNMNPGFLAVRGTSGFYNLIAQSSGSYYGPLFTWETNKLTWYATRNAIAQANVSNEKYYYFFVGI